MKIIYKRLLIIAFVFSAAAYLYAADDSPGYKYGYKEGYQYGYKEYDVDEKITVRPGMELRKIGGVNMLVPEGAEVYYDKGRYLVEGFGEYAARRFKETDERLSRIETGLISLNDEIEALRKTVEAIPQLLYDDEERPAEAAPVFP